MKQRKSPVQRVSRNRFLYGLVVFVILAYVVFHIGRSFAQSLFFAPVDRLNFFVYGQNAAVYSLGIQDGQDYVIPFPADLKIVVPGGYGNYRVGSLGKLAKLDNNPQLLKKAASVGAASFVSYYFFDNKDTIYEELTDKAEYSLNNNLFFLYTSNASLFDRLYIYIMMGQRDIKQFKKINDLLYGTQEEFVKKNLGLFYERIYRTEKKNLQIIYTDKYNVAEKVGTVLEGSGIRVSDLTSKANIPKRCQLMEEGSDSYSLTAKKIAQFFHCDMKHGDTAVYDIIFYLGNLEKDWEVN